MAIKQQRLGRNSATYIVKLVSELGEKVALPEGVILRGEAEMVNWEQFTRAREGWGASKVWRFDEQETAQYPTRTINALLRSFKWSRAISGRIWMTPTQRNQS